MNVYSRFPDAASLSQPARIYYVHPLMLRGIAAWREVFDHARTLGSDTILTAPLFCRAEGASVFVSHDYQQADPQFELGDSIDDAIGELSRLAKDNGLSLMMDIVPGRMTDTANVATAATDPPK